jgi:hypothetical protein
MKHLLAIATAILVGLLFLAPAVLAADEIKDRDPVLACYSGDVAGCVLDGADLVVMFDGSGSSEG